ncbi:MAG: (d)CMP kinase [Planctomycetia bacterium]|jgi:cytidylate kinase|nr:(d)CMP kinase [Planctomycetia bacterium]
MRTMPAPSDDPARTDASREDAEVSPLIVTIDGPAGTGKSTVAQRVAERLGLMVLDTGAMYRAAALLAIRLRADPADGDAVAKAIEAHVMEVDFTADPPTLQLDGRDPGDELRSREVEAIVSIVAAQPEVRRRLVAVQRAIAASHPHLVTEGRDQGSVVFPDAQARFYLTASSAIRAKRRVDQLRRKGQSPDPVEIREGIEARDRLDAGRSDAPLTRPVGAIEIDTDHLGLDEVVDRMIRSIPARGERA